MFKVENRTASINFSNGLLEEVNEKLKTLQENNGSFPDIKSVFLYLLDKALQPEPENNELPDAITADEMRSHIYGLTDSQFPSEERPHETDNARGIFLNMCNIIHSNDLYIDTLTGQLEAAKNDSSGRRYLEASEIAVSLTEKEQQLLSIITENRNKEFGTEKTDAETLHDIFYNKATLGNWSGFCYTGISAPRG